jgi:hypothetical protein
MDDGTYHGRGKATFLNGQVYEGDFDQGVMHGEGVLTWTNGTVGSLGPTPLAVTSHPL